MIALLLAAASLDPGEVAAVPRWDGVGAQRPRLVTLAIVVDLERERATIQQTLQLRNRLDGRVSGRAVVETERHSSSPDSGDFAPVRATWMGRETVDENPFFSLEEDDVNRFVSRRRRDRLPIGLEGRSSGTLRVSQAIELRRVGLGRAERELEISLSGISTWAGPIDHMTATIRFAPNAVFGVVATHPAAMRWQVGDRGAYGELRAVELQPDSIRLRFHPNGFEL
jgi:hypothetical protein